MQLKKGIETSNIHLTCTVDCLQLGISNKNKKLKALFHTRFGANRQHGWCQQQKNEEKITKQWAVTLTESRTKVLNSISLKLFI